MFIPVPSHRQSFLRQFWGLPRPAKNILVGTFCARFASFMIWPFFAILMARNFGTSIAELGVVFSLSAFAALIASPVSGIIADKLNRRAIMLISALSTLGFYCVLAFGKDEQIYFAVIVGMAVANGALEPLLRSALGDCATKDEDRPLLFHIRYYLVNIAGALGPLCGLWFANQNSNFAFLVGAVAYAVLALCIMKSVAPSVVVSGREEIPVSTLLKTALVDRLFLTLFISNFFLVILYAQIDDPLTFFLMSLETPDINGIIASINVTNTSVVLVVHLFLMKWLVELEEHKAILAAFFFLMLGLLVIASNRSEIRELWLVAIALATLAEIIAMPLFATVVDRTAPVRLRNSYMGLYMLSNAGAAAVPFAAAMVIEHIGGGPLFLTSAIMCVPVAYLGFRLLSATRQREEIAEQAS
ncbi:Dipeptide and tripeptide permease A [Pseudovibrio axinellae]|uniref:Dipeptide and tripeptide permease A n=1 Tax=Pseudovibrio axinellae TaxID=989403 RepID=A0A165WR83_9HYPH|nr:MFS transporter [Pseudovibrio axinellae]KZL16805.1 Dipeptide and tripeptide permease A [Pseudovibrio axinellae]SER68559.1 Major Facilitator Superfamily protein [Pseudovibrio axinellae]